MKLDDLYEKVVIIDKRITGICTKIEFLAKTTDLYDAILQHQKTCYKNKNNITPALQKALIGLITAITTAVSTYFLIR